MRAEVEQKQLQRFGKTAAAKSSRYDRPKAKQEPNKSLGRQEQLQKFGKTAAAAAKRP